jgi:hypothetical protein
MLSQSTSNLTAFICIDHSEVHRGGQKVRCEIESVYVVNDRPLGPTVIQPCRISARDAALLSRQASRRHFEVSTLSSLYLKEKALEEEFPGIGFRDAVGGREAYVLGQRVAVWEVFDVFQEAKSIRRTANHFGWPDDLVKCALAFVKEYPEEIARERHSEVGE